NKLQYELTIPSQQKQVDQKLMLNILVQRDLQEQSLSFQQITNLIKRPKYERYINLTQTCNEVLPIYVNSHFIIFLYFRIIIFLISQSTPLFLTCSLCYFIRFYRSYKRFSFSMDITDSIDYFPTCIGHYFVYDIIHLFMFTVNEFVRRDDSLSVCLSNRACCLTDDDQFPDIHLWKHILCKLFRPVYTIRTTIHDNNRFICRIT